MKDIQKSMKLSIIFGLLGAVALPFVYEIYANVAQTAALVLIACYAVVAGIVFSSLSMRSALLGITVTLAYNSILGMIGYVIIHPLMEKFLEDHSVYFQLSLQQQAKFLLYTALLLICMYPACLAKKGILRAAKQFRINSDKAGAYIEDAFLDDGDVK